MAEQLINTLNQKLDEITRATEVPLRELEQKSIVATKESTEASIMAHELQATIE